VIRPVPPDEGIRGTPLLDAATENSDGSTTITCSPEQPAGVPDGNRIHTVPGDGWFTLLRLYSPLPPLFDCGWRPGEIDRTS
jgi:hypothetical protein